MNNNAIVKQAAGSRAELIGFADMQALEKTYPDIFDNLSLKMPFGISLGKALSRGILDTIKGGPNPLYFSLYRQVNYLLDRVSMDVATAIEAAGFKALAIPASQIISREPMSGHICHRRVGWQAGLGARGLNNLLVSPEYGAAVRWATVLTDMPLETGRPQGDLCNQCGLCIDICPAGAIKPEAEDFDLPACKAKLDEFTRIPFIGQHICGVCVSACRGKRT